MPVSRVVTVNLGAVQIQPSEFLLYTLSAGVGSPLWAFGCIEGSKLASTDFSQVPHEWQLGGARPSAPELRHVLLDRGESSPDRYVLDLQFGGTATYKLRVVKQPGNQLIQDISYESHINTDSFAETLRVTLVKDEK
jgi:hypothetical protein